MSLERMICLLVFFALTCICESGINTVKATIDVNLPELQYLAAHLEPHECRRLIAALHFDDYELPEHLDEAERQVSEEIPCLQHLLHWNSADKEGLGQTHQRIEHRLRQLGHQELADWLGRTTFQELGNDLLDSIDEPFGELADGPNTTTTENYFITTEDDFDVSDDTDDDAFWSSVNMILMALFVLLIFTLCLVVGAVIIDRVARCRPENDEIPIDQDCDENRKLLSS